MNILVYGDDTALIEQRIKELKQHFLKTNSDGEIIVIDSEALPLPAEMVDVLTTVTLLGNKRCFVLKGLLSHTFTAEYENFWYWIAQIPPEFAVIYVDYTAEILKKSVQVQEWQKAGTLLPRLTFACLKGRSLNTALTLTGSQKQYLDQVYQADPLFAYQELGKVALLVDAGHPELIEEVFARPELSVSVFKLTDAFFMKRSQATMESLETLFGQGENEHMLLGLLINQLKKLIFVMDADVRGEPVEATLKALKIHPFVAKNMQQQKRLFTLAEAQLWLQRLLEIDLQSKQGKVDAKVALGQFCVSIDSLSH